ncbi:hypothetical protein [Funiculus sociatus]|nr:hypothetical protein [Cyanobacteria bacterium FACHB-472]
MVVFLQSKGWQSIARKLVSAGGQKNQKRWYFESLAEAQAFVENFDK